jgi:hypothetical protein
VRASRLIRREHEDCTCACTRTAGCRPTGDTTARRSGCVTHSSTCTYDARESVGALFRRRSVVVSWRQSAPCASHNTHARAQAGASSTPTAERVWQIPPAAGAYPPHPGPALAHLSFAYGQTPPRHRGTAPRELVSHARGDLSSPALAVLATLVARYTRSHCPSVTACLTRVDPALCLLTQHYAPDCRTGVVTTRTTLAAMATRHGETITCVHWGNRRKRIVRSPCHRVALPHLIHFRARATGQQSE